ncbi:MAG TPA: DCC1-like thiol-disulfide oxidoreductase family protein [Candidatus Angelobacter sp.]
MRRLYLLYDERCELCCRLKEWLAHQEAWLELRLVPSVSPGVLQMFPGLDRVATADDLVAISDEGEVYLNNRAWIMCLYALVEYREWAWRLSHPLLLPLARQAFAAISKNRHAISRWLKSAGPDTIADELRQAPMAPCSIPEGTISDYLR